MKIYCRKTLEIVAIKTGGKSNGKVEKFGIEFVTNTYTGKKIIIN